jgi:hypothetical protein
MCSQRPVAPCKMLSAICRLRWIVSTEGPTLGSVLDPPSSPEPTGGVTRQAIKDWRAAVVYSVEFRYPQGYVVRKNGSSFCLLRLRCGHEHLTIRSAAECKDRLAKSSRVIRYLTGRFGKVAEMTTHRVVTDEEIRKARATELDIAEAFRIVLNLAKEHIKAAKTKTGERARQIAACAIVERFVVRLR